MRKPITDSEKINAALDWALGEAKHEAECRGSGSCLTPLFHGGDYVEGIELAIARIAKIEEETKNG